MEVQWFSFLTKTTSSLASIFISLYIEVNQTNS